MKTITIDITHLPERIPLSYQVEHGYHPACVVVDSVGLAEPITAEGNSEAEAIINFLSLATEKFKDIINLKLED